MRFYAKPKGEQGKLLAAERCRHSLRLCYAAKLPVGVLCDAQGMADPDGSYVTYDGFSALVKRLRKRIIND